MKKLAAMGLALAVILAVLPSQASGQTRWAAVDPNNEGSLRVEWDVTEAGARQRAVNACTRVSRTCARNPASIDLLPGGNEKFVYMCCRRPRLGCAIGAGDKRELALDQVLKTFRDAGYSDCDPPRNLSATTGRRE